MPAIAVNPPFPLFTDADGQPLDDAYIYIGTANQNPVSNPIAVYWDSALTIPAAQPIRTSGGYPVYNGSLSRFYAASAYSILVRDKNGSFVYTSPNETLFQSSEIVFTQAGVGAVARTAQNKMREFVSVKDFGAVGDGVTDDTAEIQLALNSGAFGIYFPDGDYLCGGLTVPAAVQKIYGAGRLLANANNVTVLQVLTDVSRQRVKTIEGLRVNGNSFTGVTGIKFGSTTNNPSPGAQEAVLYVAMRDVLVRACATGIDSRVSMEHHYDSVVCVQNTVGIKLYSDSVNGGGNANTFTAVRFQSNAVGTMLVSNTNFPVHNNVFLGCIWQENTVCGLFAQGFSSAGAVAGMVVKCFHVEGNGTGAATTTIDGITVKRSDFYFVRTSASLEDSDLASSVNPCVLAETSSRVSISNVTGYGNTTGIVYSPDATSQINESGLSVSTGVKYVETYGLFNSMGNVSVIGSPRMNLGFYRNNSAMANPAIPTLDNTTGAIAASIEKKPNLGLMSSIQFAASPGSASSNRNYWNNGNGNTGDFFLFSVICMTNANTTIRFETLQTGAYKTFDVSFVANVPKRIVVGGILLGSQGLQVYTYPTDSVGAVLSFKAHTYILTTDLSVINDVYQNGLCGVKTLNYEQLSAAPTTGTWTRNEVVWNSASAASTTPGWVCVASGTPGTWKAMANLAA